MAARAPRCGSRRRPLAAAPADSGPATGGPACASSISDQGPGIARRAPAAAHRALLPRRRRARRAGRGTGLGLAIVKHMLRRPSGASRDPKQARRRQHVLGAAAGGLLRRCGCHGTRHRTSHKSPPARAIGEIAAEIPPIRRRHESPAHDGGRRQRSRLLPRRLRPVTRSASSARRPFSRSRPPWPSSSARNPA